MASAKSSSAPRQGIVIRFKEEDVRPMGRTAHGVRGITLEEGNEVIGMETITPDSTTAILTVTENAVTVSARRSTNTGFRAVAEKALSA